MKKTILFLFLYNISLTLLAQPPVKHLMFEDIPIDGERREFIGKLIQKKYEYIPTDDKPTLEGVHMGFKCYVTLPRCPANDNITGVKVDIPSSSIWSELSANYFFIKDSLIKKYGQPSECTEKFLTDSSSIDDWGKIKNAQYNATFSSEIGTIILYIDGSWISLEYSDKVNSSLAQYDVFSRSYTKTMQIPNEVYKLFPTNNIWTFIKLNTRNGKMWQVQFDIEENRFETILHHKDLVSKTEERNGRFTLYPTTNTYNFILLDQIDGRTWQVQWSQKRENRGILPINDEPNKSY